MGSRYAPPRAPSRQAHRTRDQRRWALAVAARVAAALARPPRSGLALARGSGRRVLRPRRPRVPAGASPSRPCAAVGPVAAPGVTAGERSTRRRGCAACACLFTRSSGDVPNLTQEAFGLGTRAPGPVPSSSTAFVGRWPAQPTPCNAARTPRPTLRPQVHPVMARPPLGGRRRASAALLAACLVVAALQVSAHAVCGVHWLRGRTLGQTIGQTTSGGRRRPARRPVPHAAARPHPPC